LKRVFADQQSGSPAKSTAEDAEALLVKDLPSKLAPGPQ
jgi:hypothetical protein